MSKSFRKYWKARPSGDELDKVFAEMRGESSRAAVLVGTAMLEDVLRGVVAFKCMHLTETEKADLLDGMGPLSAFSAKIKAAYAFGLIGAKTRDDLEVVREIRNAFAHGIRPLDFDNPSIVGLVAGMNTMRDLGSLAVTKDEFVEVIHMLMTFLTSRMHNPPFHIDGINHLD
jgi:hypothetical protein